MKADEKVRIHLYINNSDSSSISFTAHGSHSEMKGRSANSWKGKFHGAIKWTKVHEALKINYALIVTLSEIKRLPATLLTVINSL